jgi:glycosyltransferase involved in cell wall biosynthesis
MPKISIVIPVFNEINTIETLLKKVDAVDFGNIEKEIVIVDDFSTDGTRDFLKNLKKENYNLIFHDINSGKGMAVKHGLAGASGDFFAIQDADLEYEPADYENLLKPLLEKEANIVFGSRFPGLNKWAPISRLQFLAHRTIDYSSRLLSGVKINDPTSCYKVFDRKFRDYFLPRFRSKGFAMEVELVAMVGKGKFGYLEAPIHYYPRSYNEGKKITWLDGIKILAAILKQNIL